MTKPDQLKDEVSTMIDDIMTNFTRTRPDEREPFGDHWCGPDRFTIWETTLVARYKKQPGDGQPVEVYCDAGPARFYKIVALPSQNSIGEPKDGFTLSTGSDMAQLAADMAEAISEGMLGLD